MLTRWQGFFWLWLKLCTSKHYPKKSNINQCAINHVNCYIMVVANLWKLQNFAVYIIMQSAKIVRLLIETLVKSHILERYIGDIRQTKLLAWTFVWAGMVCYPFPVVWGTYCSAHYMSLYSLLFYESRKLKCIQAERVFSWKGWLLGDFGPFGPTVGGLYISWYLH